LDYASGYLGKVWNRKIDRQKYTTKTIGCLVA